MGVFLSVFLFHYRNTVDLYCEIKYFHQPYKRNASATVPTVSVLLDTPEGNCDRRRAEVVFLEQFLLFVRSVPIVDET
jgi:hypothetical protein